MTSLVIILWITNVCFDTLGQISFKLAATSPKNRDGWYYWLDLLTNVWVWTGIGFYLCEFLLWLAFLTLVPLSQAVLLGSVNIIAVMIVGRILFREKMTPFRIIGMLLITGGVVLVGVS